tara:strand:+ start:210 stop:473 length:264 start_codon:yes stop_codon:yes gene_type:complete
MNSSQNPTGHTRIAIRNLVIKLFVYGILITVYALLVLQWLSNPLQELFNSNMTMYAAASLALIIAQGVLLERLTSFLLARLGMHQHE